MCNTGAAVVDLTSPSPPSPSSNTGAAVVDLTSPSPPSPSPTSSSSPSSSPSSKEQERVATAATSKSGKEQYVLSLVPLKDTFRSELLQSAAAKNGPPTLTLKFFADDVPEEPQQHSNGNELQEGPRILLGRNEKTKIKATYVSRVLADVQLVRNGSNDGMPEILMTTYKEGGGCMQLNGEGLRKKRKESLRLKPGDVLSLFEREFQYQVHLQEYLHRDKDQKVEDRDHDQKRVQTEENEKEPSRSGKTIINQAERELTEDSKCPLCFEILCNASMLHPCGHIFCSSCLTENGLDRIPSTSSSQSQSEEFYSAKEEYQSDPQSQVQSRKGPLCPQCRRSIASVASSCYLVDNMVWNNILALRFSADDVQHYLERSGKTLTEIQAKHVFGEDEDILSAYLSSREERPKKRLRCHDGHSSVLPSTNHATTGNHLVISHLNRPEIHRNGEIVKLKSS